MSKYFDTYIEINSVATHVLQYGFDGLISEQNKAKDPTIVVMISGLLSALRPFRQ